MKKYFLGLTLIVFAVPAFALKDARTQDMLIKKFKKVRSALAPANPSRVQISLRLADLLSEKARRLAMEEINKGCSSNCMAGVKERNEALSIYKENLKSIPEHKRGRVFTQMGHLFQLNAQQGKAIELYSQVAKTSKNPALIAEAEFSLAEIYFKQRSFKKALAAYNKALAFPGFKRKGLAIYRKSWSQFNSGQVGLAVAGLEKVLGDPVLLNRESASSGLVSVDVQFQEEVSRDLAVFYAKRPASIDDARRLYKLSPEKARMSHLNHFAGELERMGQKQVSAEVWEFAGSQQTDPRARLESYIHLASLKRETQKIDEALENYQQALNSWKESGCTDENCSEFKTRLRKLVLDWNSETKKQPGLKLLEAYKLYLSSFNEGDMSLWAAQVAASNSLWNESIGLYKKSLALITPQEEQKLISKEKILLTIIEVAEKSKDLNLKRQAYNSYLDSDVKKTKRVEVQYQLAHMDYEAKDYHKAAESLKAVALLPTKGSLKLRLQAADLALDSLVLLKDDQKIEQWGKLFAQQFPQKSKDFSLLAQKSVLNQSAALVSQATTMESTLSAWQTLLKIDPAKANPEVKKTYYKNKMLLAEKLKKYTEVKLAAGNLLGIKNITPEDRELALGKIVWVSELKLDFKSAFKFSRQMKLMSLTPEKKALKLAMLAELSGNQPDPFYSQFLKISKDEKKKRAVITKLVEASRTPQSLLVRHKSVLGKDPESLAFLHYKKALETKNFKKAHSLVKEARFKKTKSGKAILRYSLLEKLLKKQTQLSSLQLDSKNQARLNKTMKKRVSSLGKLEKLAAQSIQIEDWMTQAISMRVLADESQRFYQDLMSLPLPEGLTAEEQGQYMQILSSQASPYKAKAGDLNNKLKEMWGRTGLTEEFNQVLKGQMGALRKRTQYELAQLAQFAPDHYKGSLASLSALAVVQKEELPSLSLLEAARDKVRAEPMNKQFLEELKILETKIGNETMSAYLQGRIERAQL